MSRGERVVENLNRGLHDVLASDPRTVLIGEDILDPYGGAFKASKGLSSKFPDRVLTTPLSEGAIVGLACGLAFCGDRPIVEIMFGDFMALAFDQVLNMASKSVTMYGRRVSLPMVIRCPTGGNRAYGPTHSQSLQKHFIGIPNLHLFELSAFHDSGRLLTRLLGLDHPCVLFEDKTLYGQRVHSGGEVDDLFSFEFLDPDAGIARVFSKDFTGASCVIIAPGGLAQRSLIAARRLFIDHEIECEVLVPSRLYPLDLAPMLSSLRSVEQVFLVEESVAGGTWGAEVAQKIYEALWGELKNPIRSIHSRDSIIPSAAHLEKDVIVQADDIYETIMTAVLHA